MKLEQDNEISKKFPSCHSYSTEFVQSNDFRTIQIAVTTNIRILALNVDNNNLYVKYRYQSIMEYVSCGFRRVNPLGKFRNKRLKSLS